MLVELCRPVALLQLVTAVAAAAAFVTCHLTGRCWLNNAEAVAVGCCPVQQLQLPHFTSGWASDCLVECYCCSSSVSLLRMLCAGSRFQTLR